MPMDKATALTIKAYEKHAQTAAQFSAVEELQYEQWYFLHHLKGNKVLDAGCGAGHHTLFFHEMGKKVIGIDLSPAMLRIAKQQKGRKQILLSVMDMRSLGFAHESINGIWCYHAFSHIPKEYALLTLKEFQRVLAPEGILFLQVAAGTGEKRKKTKAVNRSPYHMSYYTQEEIEELIFSLNFILLKAEIKEEYFLYWLKKEVQA